MLNGVGELFRADRILNPKPSPEPLPRLPSVCCVGVELDQPVTHESPPSVPWHSCCPFDCGSTACKYRVAVEMLSSLCGETWLVAGRTSCRSCRPSGASSSRPPHVSSPE